MGTMTSLLTRSEVVQLKFIHLATKFFSTACEPTPFSTTCEPTCTQDLMCNCKHTKPTHATRVQNTTLYSDGTAHSKQHRSKGVKPNGSPYANNHCSTQYERSFRHYKLTHTYQKAATDQHYRQNH